MSTEKTHSGRSLHAVETDKTNDFLLSRRTNGTKEVITPSLSRAAPHVPTERELNRNPVIGQRVVSQISSTNSNAVKLDQGSRIGVETAEFTPQTQLQANRPVQIPLRQNEPFLSLIVQVRGDLNPRSPALND